MIHPPTFESHLTDLGDDLERKQCTVDGEVVIFEVMYDQCTRCLWLMLSGDVC